VSDHGSNSPDQRDPDRGNGLLDLGESRRMMRQAGVFAFVGLEFVAAVLVGYWVGDWADHQLDTVPWLMALGVLLGFTAVCWNLYLTLRRLGGMGDSGAGHDSETADGKQGGGSSDERRE
jgi:F0F1-type ATP synthase assembly protein I